MTSLMFNPGSNNRDNEAMIRFKQDVKNQFKGQTSLQQMGTKKTLEEDRSIPRFI